jgi:hypothetical protein
MHLSHTFLIISPLLSSKALIISSTAHFHFSVLVDMVQMLAFNSLITPTFSSWQNDAVFAKQGTHLASQPFLPPSLCFYQSHGSLDCKTENFLIARAKIYSI